jgi:hypothetical protein
MLSDPLSVTYNGSAESLARVSAGSGGTRYTTADGEFEFAISNFSFPRYGGMGAMVTLTRLLPDPTPADAFDAYRNVHNTFGFVYGFDPIRAETSVDVPRLRAALISFVDSSLQTRILGGEK